MKNKLNNLSGKEWLISTKSVIFSNPSKRDELKIQHPATFAESDIGELIKFFTKKGEHILDPFVGVASTSISSLSLGRKSTGIDLTKRWINLGKKRIKRSHSGVFINENIKKIKENKVNLICGDAREILDKLGDETFDFIVTSPPYWSILKNKSHKIKRERSAKGYFMEYSKKKGDLGNIPFYGDFLNKLVEIFDRCKDVLKKGKYLCIIVSDFQNKSNFHMFHADLAKLLVDDGWQLRGNTILVQNNKNLYPYGMPFAYVPNIIHQNILIFRKK